MNLSSTAKEELRDMGWSLVRRQAKRPAAIPSDDVLHVGEDVTFDEHPDEPQLVKLDSER